ncbi:MAG: metal-dependent hydrolase, partial [Candidatus Sumerlaeota bacterium]|nr:metal-dependent hydrolase [Candidatus Sumerlaeota bacterium]
IKDNPQAPKSAAALKPNYIVVTHAHADHLGDAVDLAKRSGATIVANFEIASYCAAKGCKIEPMHIGGAIRLPFGRVKLTQAFHGSTVEIDGKPYALGMPTGVVITIGGKNVYHAGDTGLFGDMRLIGDEGLDVALLPIGDRFTMGVKDAVTAAQFLRPKMAVPIHYNTWGLIQVDPAEFVSGCQAIGIKAQIVAPGQSIEF